MLCQLPDDLILMIIFNLNSIHDVINLSSINKATYKLFDDNLYIDWGRNQYSNEFWDRAHKRSPIVSKPLLNMKMELLRLDKFTDYQIRHGLELWTNEDFYKYWHSMENALALKKLKNLDYMNCKFLNLNQEATTWKDNYFLINIYRLI